MLYSIGKFAKEIGVTTQTLRNWHKDGILVPSKVTEGGTRYYSDKQISEYINGSLKTEQDRKIVIYSRVSSMGQKDDLNNQTQFLQQFANAKGWIVSNIYTDIGSGLNFNRKNWNLILSQVRERKIEKIIIAHKDRFLRFGYDWFESFVKEFDCEIVIVNNEVLSPQEELVQDLISIIHVFSCRIYGLRKYKKALSEDSDVKSL